MKNEWNKLLRWIILFMLSLVILSLFTCERKPQIIEKEVIKEIVVTDTVFVDKIVEVKVPEYITKEIIKEVEIPVEVIKEVIVEKPVEVVKTIYVDKPFETIVEVPRPEVSQWYLGMGAGFDKSNFISILRASAIYKTKKNKAFSLDLGVSNKIWNQETGQSSLTPYIGATMYWKIGTDK